MTTILLKNTICYPYVILLPTLQLLPQLYNKSVHTDSK